MTSVTVFNPGPNGGESGSVLFTINSPPPGVIETVSIATDGTQGNAISDQPSVSADGRFVAFHSFANTLVAGDTNGSVDVFVRDTCLGVAVGCAPSTLRVSVDSAGNQGNSASGVPSISADGRFVAFQSFANNLIAGDTNGGQDIFVRDTCLGVVTGCTPSTTRISVDSAGNQGNGASGVPSISADGRLVAFQSFASNLAAGDSNTLEDVFVRDTCFGAGTSCAPSTILVSVGSAGNQANGGSGGPSISADGRLVAFTSLASDLVVGDNNNRRDVFVRDTCLGASAGCAPSTVLVSVDSTGNQGNDDSAEPAISDDGRFVAFLSFASKLVTGDTNGTLDIFLRDTCFGAVTACIPSTTRLSVDRAGNQGNNGSDSPSISADGRFVSFDSVATNLVAGDTNANTDIFVHDSCFGAAAGCTPSTIRVSVDGAGAQADDGSEFSSLSADGRLIVFRSFASNLVPADTNSSADIFIAWTGF